MKKNIFVAILALSLIACNNSNSSKDSLDNSSTMEQTIDPEEPDALLGSIITNEGLGNLKLGTKIPDTIPGYEVLFLIREIEEGMEDVIVEVTKDDKLILQIQPGYVDETDAANDTIAGLLVISDQFTTTEGFHVGTSVHDILKKKGVTTYFNEKRFFIKDNGLTYIIKPEDYDGELPEVPFDIPVEVEQPTFKPDAKVRTIGIFGE